MERWMRVPFWSGLVTVVAGSVMGGVMMMAPSGTAATVRPRAAPSTPECTKANLTAKYKGGDAAMSHVYGRIVLRNTSDETCWVQGYGGLSYVGGGNGTQVGARRTGTRARRRRTVLEPGDKVRSAIVETSYAPYPKNECRPTQGRRVPGLRAGRDAARFHRARDDRLREPRRSTCWSTRPTAEPSAMSPGGDGGPHAHERETPPLTWTSMARDILDRIRYVVLGTDRRGRADPHLAGVLHAARLRGPLLGVATRRATTRTTCSGTAG